MSTHNLYFEQKCRKYRSFLSENFQFLEMKFSIYLNRRVFVMINQRVTFLALNYIILFKISRGYSTFLKNYISVCMSAGELFTVIRSNYIPIHIHMYDKFVYLPLNAYCLFIQP